MGGIDLSTVVYRTARGFDLQAHVCRPTDRGERPAAVFFHGGGLTGGAPDQFLPECEYLASRGMVAATVAYRLLPNQAGQTADCIADARAAVAWMRGREDVDSSRVVVCGYSAGGLLAGHTALGALGPDFADSWRRDALILLNAVLDEEWLKRAAAHVNPPPTLVVHGSRDTMAPVSRARRFAEAMTSAGYRCELAEFEGAHTFFRPMGNNGSSGFIGAVSRMDAFLTDLGFVPHDATASARIEAMGESMLADVLARRTKRKRRPANGSG